MERSVAAAGTNTFTRWEEVYASTENGRREVRYYLKRRDGTSALAVVGKEKSLGHISYNYASREKSFSSSSILKLRSRREVVDWLNSVVSGKLTPPHAICSSSEATDMCKFDQETLEGGQCATEFSWVGSSWTCRKKRKHYQSYRRNGVLISVNDFVYVLAEEDKRLVAYLDDMYEDSRGNQMVVVQWFHKVDEVGIALPQNYNNREVFFSLCLQHLSIECVDGLAAVLSPEHFETFMHQATYTKCEPFVCHRQFDSDDVKPFDITQVKGYWKQEILGYMSTLSGSKSQPSSPDGVKAATIHTEAVGSRPRKRLRRSKDGDMNMASTTKQDSNDMVYNMQVPSNTSVGFKGGVGIGSLDEGCLTNDAFVPKHHQHLGVGSQIEVLSQDSGVRGCWFRALIIKKHKFKVKVRYQDIKDAADESINLEEWILASRVAVPDQLGIRLSGRAIVRPAALSNKGSSSGIRVGTVVDAWWYDGWWEGIVVQKDSEDRVYVYFPGEKRESIFGCSDLRNSQEWLGDGWKQLEGRPELVRSIRPDHVVKSGITKSLDIKSNQAAICNNKVHDTVQKDVYVKSLVGKCNFEEDPEVVRDLSKDDLLAQLKWNWSRKRRHGRHSSSQKMNCSVNKKRGGLKLLDTKSCENFLIRSSLKVDHDNCKFIRDPSLFASPVVSPLTSLVMSR